MATVSDITAFFDDFAPQQLAEEWDNTGLLIGRPSAPVKKILTCLTVTPDVVDEAVESEVNLIVSHHPVLFRGAKQISDATAEGGMLLKLIENRIAVYSPHTRFDSAAQGINQQLAESMNLSRIEPLRPDVKSNDIGGGRFGIRETQTTLRMFLGELKAATSAAYVEYVGELESPVRKVAVACGSAAEFMTDAMVYGCDTFVTGEARFHAALEARTSWVNLVLLGHFSSEHPAVRALAGMLEAAIPGVAVFPSRVERDPLSVFVG